VGVAARRGALPDRLAGASRLVREPEGAPDFTLHLKRGVRADLAAQALPIEDPAERRDVFTRLLAGSGYDLERWIAGSPLVEVALG
jgi:hypothetical protein